MVLLTAFPLRKLPQALLLLPLLPQHPSHPRPLPLLQLLLRQPPVQPVLLQSAWFRPHNRSEDFANLYFAGAGTHPGAGLPGVLASGKIVAELIGGPAAVKSAIPAPPGKGRG